MNCRPPASYDAGTPLEAAGSEYVQTILPVRSLATTDRHWAHAMFDFVAAQHGAEGTRQLLFALRAHQSLPQAVPMAFGVTLDQFDREFSGYARARFGQP